MALTDLLWACPCCGERSGWTTRRGVAHCEGCSTRFRRGPASVVVAEGPDGRETAPAEEWASRLPELELPRPGEPETRLTARARLSTAARAERVRFRGRFLGTFERAGTPTEGELSLSHDRLHFRSTTGEERSWDLAAITALQASSRTLQVKPHGEPVLAVRFLEDSCRYWEELLKAALRRRYAEDGRGHIIEFQPRIETA